MATIASKQKLFWFYILVLYNFCQISVNTQETESKNTLFPGGE